jgi:cytochrome c oxidase assembly factor 6
MGWLPWSSGDSNKNEASDGGRIAPDRTSRARCWEGRDRFFACLDKNDILDGIKDDKKARQKCASEVAEFEAACSQSWVRTAGSLFGCSGLSGFGVSWLVLSYICSLANC